ncbi:hypothetical protein B9Z55_001104 [Caenorhabditis nigoni]|uniref:Uncharacterized protein n=1 Tax=Caenorhabditis nigoni TaxID=1611254 RepID=A0A2G5VE48_9PELO|nr:hypothetical protein B9Z55_001104 [Caenorhabditis nigoni]
MHRVDKSKNRSSFETGPEQSSKNGQKSYSAILRSSTVETVTCVFAECEPPYWFVRNGCSSAHGTSLIMKKSKLGYHLKTLEIFVLQKVYLEQNRAKF